MIRGLRPETVATWVTTGGSALLSILLYSTIWNCWIAGGLVFGMWVHELGHRMLLRRLGLGAAPIVFVPFIGAVQRVSVPPVRALDRALIALAGPCCGLLFATACKLGHLATSYSVLRFLAVAHAMLAVIDLLPFGVLDGGRVVAVLTRHQRVACVLTTTALAILCQSPLLAPVCIALAWKATRPAPSHAEPWVVALYLAMLGCALCLTR